MHSIIIIILKIEKKMERHILKRLVDTETSIQGW